MVINSIIKRLLDNDKITNLLYYNDTTALSQPLLNSEQRDLLIDKHIHNVPVTSFTDNKSSFIIITLNNVTPNSGNTQHIDYTVTINVLCHQSLWRLDDGLSRPHIIMDELYTLLNSGKYGMGKDEFSVKPIAI
jgi:hypothetical protein